MAQFHNIGVVGKCMKRFTTAQIDLKQKSVCTFKYCISIVLFDFPSVSPKFEIGWKGFPARAFGERTAEKEDENRISCSTKPFKMSWPPRSGWSYRHLITASSSLVHFHNCRVVRFKKVHLSDLKSIFHSRSLSLGERIFGPGKPGKRARDIILTSSLLCAHTKGGRISRNLRTSTCHPFGGGLFTQWERADKRC